jgi:hypothetical protein
MSKFAVGARVGLRWNPSHLGTVEEVSGTWFLVRFDSNPTETFTYRARDLVEVQNEMDLRTFKSAVRARDLKLIAKGYEQMLRTLSAGEVYRLALAADPDLDRPTWTDLVTEAVSHGL